MGKKKKKQDAESNRLVGIVENVCKIVENGWKFL